MSPNLEHENFIIKRTPIAQSSASKRDIQPKKKTYHLHLSEINRVVQI